MTVQPKLTDRQYALLERACLKRYTVDIDNYMGSFQPNRSVSVWDGEPWKPGSIRDRSFRSNTVDSLVEKGLVCTRSADTRSTYATVKPTREGLDLYKQKRRAK